MNYRRTKIASYVSVNGKKHNLIRYVVCVLAFSCALMGVLCMTLLYGAEPVPTSCKGQKKGDYLLVLLSRA